MNEHFFPKLPIFGEAGPYLKFEDLQFVGCQVSPACSSGKSSSKMKVNMKEWWNYTNRANRSARRTPSPILTFKS